MSTHKSKNDSFHLLIQILIIIKEGKSNNPMPQLYTITLYYLLLQAIMDSYPSAIHFDTRTKPPNLTHLHLQSPYTNKLASFKYEIQYTNELIDHEIAEPIMQKFKTEYIRQTIDTKVLYQQPLTINRQQISAKQQPFQQHEPVHFHRDILSKGLIKGVINGEGGSLGNSRVDRGVVNGEGGCLVDGVVERGRGKESGGKQKRSQIMIKQQWEEQQIKGNLNRKGLALISSLILEVLERQYKQNKKFTCGEISLKVFKEYCNKFQQKCTPPLIDEKEKKTIKRRVYDSINVLIALGKIKKDRKYLYLQSIDQKLGQQIIEAKRKKLSFLEGQCQRKNKENQRIRSLYAKLISIKRRNQETLQSKDQPHSRSFSTFQPSNTYKFPLLFLHAERGNKISMTIQEKEADGKERGKSMVIFHSGGEGVSLFSELNSLDYLRCMEERSEF